jgi:hypothetical protein
VFYESLVVQKDIHLVLVHAMRFVKIFKWSIPNLKLYEFLQS